jgi:6-phosphogluconolactonase (cycloisomerase 2 family)
VGYRVNADTGELEPVASAAFGTPTLGGALALAPSGHYLYSSAGGLNTFSIDSQTGALGLLSPTPYSLDVGGDSYSRVLALDPTGQFAFSVHMLNGHFGAFQVAPSTGILSGLEGFPVTLAQGVYSVGVEPSGRFVYVGSDAGTISGYSLDRVQRTLTAMSGPPFPLDGLQPEIAFVTLGLR